MLFVGHAGIFVFVGAHPVGDGLQGDASQSEAGACATPIAHRGGLLQKSDPLNAVQGDKGPDAQPDLDRGLRPLLSEMQLLQSIDISFVGPALQRVDKRLTK